MKAKFFLILVIAAGLYFFSDELISLYRQIGSSVASLEEFTFEAKKVAQRAVNNPPPLRLERGDPESFLTAKGVVERTNFHRSEAGFTSLSVSSALSQAAATKVDDMFDGQFFAHKAPDGTEVDDLAEQANYEFIAIGENLALGNFKDDQMLVKGWMDSPGHRANILKESYDEIGVAVGKGVFEGQSTWLAVQVFGRPLSSCFAADPDVLDLIERNRQKISELNTQILDLQSVIDASAGEPEETNNTIDQHNALVQEHNSLVNGTKALVESYNSTVVEFNACVKE